MDEGLCNFAELVAFQTENLRSRGSWWEENSDIVSMPQPVYQVSSRRKPDNSGKKSGRLLQTPRAALRALAKSWFGCCSSLYPPALVQMLRQQPWEHFQVLPLRVSFPIACLSFRFPPSVSAVLNMKTYSSSDISNLSNIVSFSGLQKCLTSQTLHIERVGVSG